MKFFDTNNPNENFHIERNFSFEEFYSRTWEMTVEMTVGRITDNNNNNSIYFNEK